MVSKYIGPSVQNHLWMYTGTVTLWRSPNYLSLGDSNLLQGSGLHPLESSPSLAGGASKTPPSPPFWGSNLLVGASIWH